ncbi:MAG: hypothetical protein EP315_03265 [Gammaproteobacteria bacterium]|nr:MAG: hypothetical protein EP315_03265 [Gammaproteobacteria bacterium]
MKQPLLPEYLDFAQKAKKGFEIAGLWPVNRLDRLSDLLVSEQGEIQAQLTFGRKAGVLYVSGQVSAPLQVICQRCMQPMDLLVQTRFLLGLVHDEAAADRLPDGYEPLMLEEGPMRVPDLLEEELLLAMPLVPMHDVDCSDYLQQQKQRQKAEQAQDEANKKQQNPFAVLKDLL